MWKVPRPHFENPNIFVILIYGNYNLEVKKKSCLTEIYSNPNIFW